MGVFYIANVIVFLSSCTAITLVTEYYLPVRLVAQVKNDKFGAINCNRKIVQIKNMLFCGLDS